MLKMIVISLILIASLSGCIQTPGQIKAMDKSEIRTVTSDRLCSLVNNGHKSPAINYEVKRRKLNCKKRREAYVRQQQQSQRQPVRPSGRPISCQKTRYIGLSAKDGRTIKYRLQEKAKSVAQRGKETVCITQIKATEKLDLRNSTVIYYQASLYYPEGYRNRCKNLQQGSTYSWNKFTKAHVGGCHGLSYMTDPYGQPASAGERRTYSGKVTF